MKKIGVVGSINMDMTVKAERIPLKGETVKGEDLKYIPGGKGANQAVAMAKLGANVEMFGCVGDDSAGISLVENLRDVGVETKCVKTIHGIPTGLAMITVGENDNTIVVVAGTNDCVDIAYIDEIKEELLKCEIVLLQHEIPQKTIEYVVDLCYENDVKVVLNPGPARPVKKEVLDKVTYLTPNEHETVILFGEEQSFEELLKKYPDIVGALAFANTAAGLSTEKFGAQGGMPSREEVKKRMEA